MNIEDSTKDQKIRVGIFFGGKSAEHEVSLQSARNIVEAIDTTKFTPILIGIDKSGAWHPVETDRLLGEGQGLLLTTSQDNLSATLIPGGTQELVYPGRDQPRSLIDVALPILHGPLGEDGTIQGFLEIAGIPYVGAGVLASAVGMDKDVMKRLLRDADIPVTDFVVLHAHQKSEIDTQAIIEKLSSPVFVKPANMGSSIGISRATTPDELATALETAFMYDSKILIERAVEGDEIECAILGNLNPEASVIGRIIPPDGDFYSYEAKYTDEHGTVFEIPANLPEDVTKRARDIALKTFQILGCEGMSRVDMFLTKNNQIIVNEINTIPGFTKMSVYPRLWNASGLSYADLITKLIELALERHSRRNVLKTSL